MKTYVITLSKVFPATHKRRGELTEFLEKFLNGQTGTGDFKKLHTIRANYTLWEKRIADVQRGEAVLSVRQWSGRPYMSKQIEIARLTREDGIGIQGLGFINVWGCDRYVVDCYDAPLSQLAHNDGLPVDDWLDWFKGYDKSRKLAIIHFTKFRY